MNPIEIVVGLLLVAVVLAAIAQRLRIPYPTFLVLGGLALGFFPGLPPIQIPPRIAFLVFIPPLVYHVASQFALRDLRHNRWPIFRLSVGLVLVNLLCIAGVAHGWIDGFSWATAFVLAAIVSPTDTAAVTAVARNLPVPRRVERILEGESLFNDVVTLVAYQQAVWAAATGSFSLGEATVELVWDAVGGFGVGVAVGMLATWTRRRVHDTGVHTAASLLTPFAAYLGAEAVEASGVLATVAAGLYVGHFLLASLRPAERVQVFAFWAGTRFILEGLAFVLIGTQLREVTANLSDTPSSELLRDCVLVCVTTILVRLVWMFVWVGLPYFFGPFRRTAPPRPPFGHAILIGWAGMRGVDSLAAGLALPFVMADGTTPFPQRDLILLISFSVILATLVLQGLTLPILIRRLRLPVTDTIRQEESWIRRSAAEEAIKRIDPLAHALGASPEVAESLVALYALRIRQYESGVTSVGDRESASAGDIAKRLFLELLKAERQAVRTMWSEGQIEDEARQRVERALDYEELKLAG